MDFADDRLAAGDGALAASTQTVIAFPYTGDYRIDVLLASNGNGVADIRWNYQAPFGTPVTVTYSFMTAKPVYGGTDDSDGDTGFQVFSPQQMDATRAIFARLETELNIRFVEVADSKFSYGEIRLGNNFQEFSAGYTWLPNSTGNPLSGDVWMDLNSDGTTNPVVGTYAYATLLHEIGHALGLKHPGNYNAGSGGSQEPDNYLGTSEDNVGYTVMSYTTVPGGQEREWYGIYDLLALKKLYGAGTPEAGNTTYLFDDSDGRSLQIIDDGSGYDTLNFGGVVQGGVTVDMRPGSFSSVGRNFALPASNNLSIDFATVIEKFIGTASADHVTGNDADNAFLLAGGTNTADGGAGIDTAIYNAARAAFTISGSAASGLTVTGNNIADTLTQIERLEFADRKLAFDLSGHAGIVAKLIGAVFGPAVLSAHADYVTIGLALVDGGASYAAAAQFALDARLGAHSHADVVNLLYTNVTGSAPTAEQAAPFMDLLNGGAQTQAQLAIFAADHSLNTENIGLVGLTQNGLVFS